STLVPRALRCSPGNGTPDPLIWRGRRLTFPIRREPLSPPLARLARKVDRFPVPAVSLSWISFCPEHCWCVRAVFPGQPSSHAQRFEDRTFPIIHPIRFLRPVT